MTTHSYRDKSVLREILEKVPFFAQSENTVEKLFIYSKNDQLALELYRYQMIILFNSVFEREGEWSKILYHQSAQSQSNSKVCPSLGFSRNRRPSRIRA